MVKKNLKIRILSQLQVKSDTFILWFINSDYSIGKSKESWFCLIRKIPKRLLFHNEKLPSFDYTLGIGAPLVFSYIHTLVGCTLFFVERSLALHMQIPWINLRKKIIAIKYTCKLLKNFHRINQLHHKMNSGNGCTQQIMYG